MIEWWVVLILVFSSLLIFLMTGLPIFVCFMLINIVCVLVLIGTNGLGLFINSITETTLIDALVSIPLFIMLGELMFRTGGFQRLFKALDVLVGAIPGRLYVVSIGVAAVMGAISGSALASVAILGRFVYPTMVERGCDKRLAIGTILSGATLDAIIPPSIIGVILATLVGLSISDFLIAGMGPGITLAICFAGYAVIRVLINPSLDSKRQESSPDQKGSKLEALIGVLPLVVTIFLVLGLVMMGVADTSEAAAVGIVGCLIMSFMYRTFSFKMLAEAGFETMLTTAGVLAIISSSKLFSEVLAFSGAPAGLVQFTINMNLSPYVFYWVMMAVVFVLCMFIDQVALMLILVPIYLPLVQSFGFDPLWFWMMFLINILFGGITPPLGYTLFVFKSAVPSLPLGEVYRAVWPMIYVAIVAVILMTFFPKIVTFLPSLF